jgi:hypothetical protein
MADTGRSGTSSCDQPRRNVSQQHHAVASRALTAANDAYCCPLLTVIAGTIDT